MKRVLHVHPAGKRLYELSEGEYERLEHMLTLPDPHVRANWVSRYLHERIPVAIYRPGMLGPPEDLTIDRAIGGNMGTGKWGRFRREP